MPNSPADQMLLATLSEGASFCTSCRSHNLALARALGDFHKVVHKAAHDTRDRDWEAVLERAGRALEEERQWCESHLLEPHEPPEPVEQVEKVRREPKVDDRPECPACGQKINQRADGTITKHRSRSGLQCRRRLVSVSVEAPPISLPTVSGPGRNTLSAIGECHDCGKWLPGERRFCGQCLRKRGRM